ncbi:WXG100 family type VII secretion target [Amycolatopsis endophytica]|uniref:WXG100 family type VII secretion target n=1 Tax=Amycolatopsis endophytica TaxID=860233 RepID=UPI0028AA4FFE|nr:hypothetical protein [Amycolatopsis endophytica]
MKIYSAGAAAYDATSKLREDLSDGDLGALAADAANTFNTATGFVNEAAGTITGIVSDPLGWLISNGVGFLISWIEPLNEALEVVTGDPEALEAGADAFNQLGADIETLRADTEQLLVDGLADWQGPGAAAAGERLAEFRDALHGTAGATGEIATLLAVSSAVMSVIKDVVTSIISDFVEWLIVTWLAALASSVVTCGGSVASAGAATAVRAGTETMKVNRWVTKLKSIIDKLHDLIGRIQGFLRKIPGFTKLSEKLADHTLTENLTGDLVGKLKDGTTTLGGAIREQAGEKIRESAVKAAKDQVFSTYDNLLKDEKGDKIEIPDIVGTAEKATEALKPFQDAVDRRTAAGDPDMDDADIERGLRF